MYHFKGNESKPNEQQPIIGKASTCEIKCVANQLTFTSTSFSQQSATDNIPVQVNLLKLHLPTFDGNLRWLDVCEFMHLCMERIFLVSKLSYLKGTPHG